MKCPNCNGKGMVDDPMWVDEAHTMQYLVARMKKCPACGGSGEVEMTNEEWFTNLTTEEKAEWLQEHADCVGCPASCEKCHRYYDACKETMLEWLKQPHKE